MKAHTYGTCYNIPVGDIEVPTVTRGLDLVLEMGLGLEPRELLSVEECLTLPGGLLFSSAVR